MKVQCCVCQKIRQGERWRFALYGELEGESVSTGYCPECAKIAFESIRGEKDQEAPLRVAKGQ